MSQFRSWMNLKMQFTFPPLFKIIFDAEALGLYERIFTFLMKVGLVPYLLVSCLTYYTCHSAQWSLQTFIGYFPILLHIWNRNLGLQ
jgi:hypothetical protein